MKTRNMGGYHKKSHHRYKNFSQKRIEKFVIYMKAIEIFVVIAITIGGLFLK
jgi:hypothetical protein